MEPAVQIDRLTKEFTRRDGTLVKAIDDADLVVEPGEFVVLLGPSGCGKTTLLRTIAGLETPDRGQIRVSGKTVFSSDERVLVTPSQRNLSMMFQSYALWPHMTVRNNVRYPLENRRAGKMSRSQMQEKVEDSLATVGISDLIDQYPGQLSGGQQQRTALARALVDGSRVVLFDEPLSNVDAQVREQLRIELLATQRRLGFTAIFVTHDQAEAMELATRIAVLDQGKVQQFGTPEEIYRSPATEYVATFIGSTNRMAGAWDSSAGVFRTSHGPIRVGDGRPTPKQANLLWRPEDGGLSQEDPGTTNAISGTVQAMLFMGSHTEYIVQCGEDRMRIWSSRPTSLSVDDHVWITLDPECVMVFEDSSDSRPSDEAGSTESAAGRSAEVVS
ncbi:ABC transporter ATP-binding protein [Nesterenkonia sp. NBAIMH1]|uniref:ABC transporter ATP-binding protein n=2 Tax=Nesterenkonia TaxID=57494 RepID=UPI00143CE1F7|nr:ABC transporter ATP-binding protein [Nesterenkonia sp. NBAIMH1]